MASIPTAALVVAGGLKIRQGMLMGENRLLLPGGECPLVLDDALANFDDERAGYALETIRDIARKRQVLLFTCHSREGERLSGKPDVNVIKL